VENSQLNSQDQADTLDISRFKILCVDDEPNILSALRRMFMMAGFVVEEASSGAQALKMLESNGFHLVLSDMNMPEMNGAQFLAQVRLRWPQVMRLMLTGTSDLKAAISAINEGEIYRYLIKPWNDEEVVSTIRSALEKCALIQERDQLLELTKQQNLSLADMVNTLEVKVQERTAELSNSFNALRGSYIASVKAYSTLIGLRDRALLAHSKSVADLATQMAKIANCSPDDTQDIYIAGLLHDIGKIGLSDETLANLSKGLGGYSKKLYEAHAKAGQDCLAGLYDMDRIALYIGMHHERFNGSGFPNGLKGDAIPLGARILAVVEAFEEVQIKKKDVEQLSPTDAALLINDYSGTAFCPQACQYLLKALGVAAISKKPKPSVAISKQEDGQASAIELPAPAAVKQSVLAQTSDSIKSDVLVKNLLTYSELLSEVAKFPGAQVFDERGQANGYLWVRQAGGIDNANPKLVKWLGEHKFLLKTEKGWFLPVL
jgi:response regulator RpfG family c-di-GMP phosphodiesterase